MLKRFLNAITHKRARFFVILAIVTAGVFALSFSLVQVKDKYSEHKGAISQFQQEQTAANESVLNNDKQQALEHAQKAMALAPNDFEAVMAVAALTAEKDPEAAKQYYARALEIAKQQDDPDADGKSAITYWGAAGLAEQAGFKDQAKKYYQKVIDAANPTDNYQQSLASQAKEALARLQ